MHMYNVYTGFFKNQRDKYFRKVLQRYFKRISLIVDVGCGQGDFLTQAKDLGLNAEGIDDKERWVEYCTKLGLKARKGSIFKLPYDDQSVDGVFIQSVLEHVDAVKSMGEINRIIKKDGIVAISCPTPEDTFWDDPTHLRPHTIKSLTTLFEMYEFTVIHANYVFAELLGIKISWNRLFQLLHLVPARIGSNVLVIGKKN